MSSDLVSILPKDQVLTPADGQAYEASLHRWAENAERRAKYVVLPKTPEDVSKAVRPLFTLHASVTHAMECDDR